MDYARRNKSLSERNHTRWYRRSQGAVLDFTPFDRFMSLWISFNAWARHVSRKETDRRMIEWAKENSFLRQTFNSLMNRNPEFQNAVCELKDLCPIPRHRRYKGSQEARIHNTAKWEEVLEVIYVIRCNLFHGRKSMRNEPNRQLVELAYTILGRVFRVIIGQLWRKNLKG